jgi:hypothetical protein
VKQEQTAEAVRMWIDQKAIMNYMIRVLLLALTVCAMYVTRAKDQAHSTVIGQTMAASST